ncbi:putative ABC transporter ATP-binding protein/MT1014 [Aquimixticola soesokkakensis]|uniref:Putative ABC transporter ATP-binding protein/MT1014 n=1 Tax=Aquimixticola soesokkakensis TaxID=1519096 RepID=A0A1Y5TAZ1_9RHOB|nr:ABC transporter ATP-binding protein [Aquimixticola soesokkakensis]SLN56298.1 putative ABC transporter ATP-binding protein/MT1014 [Aquimixticola soesokkakensis]
MRAAEAAALPLDLSINGLVMHDPAGRVLLDVADLSVRAGKSLGICGPSGAGKSTLLHALSGLRRATSGQILWGEHDVQAMTPSQSAAFRARYTGMIFQDFLLFDELSALDNAGLGAWFRPRGERAKPRSKAGAILRDLSVPQTARSVASFSGGERQRVGVARALASDALILLADEPTASLHRAAAEKLGDDLVALSRSGGATLITVSHDEALLARMDRVIRLENGKIVAGDAHV